MENTNNQEVPSNTLEELAKHATFFADETYKETVEEQVVNDLDLDGNSEVTGNSVRKQLEDGIIVDSKPKTLKDEVAKLVSVLALDGEIPSVVSEKSFEVTKTADVEKPFVVGNPDAWKILCKVSSEEQGWMKSTKVMAIGNKGVMMLVTTEHKSNGVITCCSETLQFMAGVRLQEINGEIQLY